MPPPSERGVEALRRIAEEKTGRSTVTIPRVTFRALVDVVEAAENDADWSTREMEAALDALRTATPAPQTPAVSGEEGQR